MNPRLSRRFFLGGAGAMVGLPFLESLFPRRSHAAPAAVAKRIVAFYVPCGIHMQAWTPAPGPNLILSPTLEPLAKVKDKVLVLTGLANDPARPDGPGDHASGTGAFLTVAHPFKTDGAGIKNGISMDQVAANKLKDRTKIASLQLGIDAGGGTGNCDSGYSCAYARNISWASETQPLPKTTNPQVVFDTLFAGFDASATSAELERRRKYKKSVLDYSIAETSSLKAKLATGDARKLDEFLSGVRDLEKKIAAPAAICTVPGKPAADHPYPDKVKIMADLMVLAMQCDLTRVITFMIGNAGSGRSYDFIGVSGGHHSISHHGSNQGNYDKLKKIDKWEVTQYAYLLEKMDAVVEANGATLLDNSMVFFSSEITDGDRHNHDNCPVVVGGRGGGAFKTGRHLTYPKQSIARLFISMLNAADVPVTRFGDADQPLGNLG